MLFHSRNGIKHALVRFEDKKSVTIKIAHCMNRTHKQWKCGLRSFDYGKTQVIIDEQSILIIILKQEIL